MAALWPGPPPWTHQGDAFAACVELLQGPQGRGLVQAPTGTGKSRTMRAVVYWLLSQRRRAIVCLPTEEILGQFVQDFRRESRQPFYLQKAEQVAPSYAQLILASHQTLWRRLDQHDPRTVLLFDECHHSNELAVRNLSTLDRFHHVLGFSASPWSTECDAVYHGHVLHGFPLSRAISEGFLCSFELWPFPDLVPAPRGFELWFFESNQEAKERARSWPGAAYLGYDSSDREQVVTGFRSGRVRRLCLNRMLVEGFDCSQVSTIWIDKQTDSDILNYQMVGRGLRRKADGQKLVVFARDPAGVRRALDRAG